MINFNSEEEYEISGKGRVFVVKNPIPPTEEVWLDSYLFLKDMKVKINGKEFYIRGIEAFAYGGKRRENDRIGLLVK